MGKSRKRTQRKSRRKPAASRFNAAKYFNNGFKKGYEAGRNNGYGKGLDQGAQGYSVPLEGTSIIIPSFNQKEYLKACIESIQRYTPQPFEIIVIDNGSTDGTNDYLKTLTGTVRYRINHDNLGFAGGVNQGLMMARGSSLLFINNDTVVTENWLSNLLACLHSDAGYGLVGPVTNYISGDQLIETAYSASTPYIEEMHRFARSHNRSDPARWKATGRLTGFCVVMTRAYFQRLGYLDEGFEIGNCEDDDYGFRAQLLGTKLIIAGDTFIHHDGSKTTKLLHDFDAIYGKNLAFYSQKWGDTQALLPEALGLQDGTSLKMTDYYPTHVLVRGTGPIVYWIEQGIRYPLEDAAGIEAVRLSQIDLRNWPVAADKLSNEALNRRRTAGEMQEGNLAEGILVKKPDGWIYQHSRGKLHRFVSAWALQAWRLDSREIFTLNEDDNAKYPTGLPIIAPLVIRASNI